MFVTDNLSKTNFNVSTLIDLIGRKIFFAQVKTILWKNEVKNS